MSERNHDSDSESPSHQRPPYSDPLAGGIDPTAPGAPHEPGGVDYHQSEERATSDQDGTAEDTERRRR